MKTVKAIILFLFGAYFLHAAAGDGLSQKKDLFSSQRLRMVEQQIRQRGVSDKQTLDAMRTVERHLFVPKMYLPFAYADQPVPIGEGQTISQPYIVGLMTEKLQLKPGCKALEIGTGSGYQAAVLSLICPQVYTIEIIPSLADQAQERLKKLGHANITVKTADGYYGWEEYAPFDAIVVTAAASHIPPALIRQLNTGGNMIIPLGGILQVQRLMVVRKKGDGSITTEYILPVRFVPLTGGH